MCWLRLVVDYVILGNTEMILNRKHTVPELQKRLDNVIEIIREAGDVAQRYRGDGLSITSKGAQDFATHADKEVEALISKRLSLLYKNDGFFDEESGPRPGTGGVWVVDPIANSFKIFRSGK